MEVAVLQIYVGPAKHRWALRGRLPDQNRLPAPAEKVGALICWPRKLEAGAESPAGRALIVGAVKRFRSLTKPRMGAWLTEDYEGLQTETTTTVCWQVLEISAVVCCPRILKGGAEDRLPKVGLSLTCRI